MPLRERSKRVVVLLQQEARNLRLNPPPPFAAEDRSRNSASPTGAADDFAVTPRRRSGQERRAPVVLTREIIESYFSMPLSAASKDLGLCATAIKKVCRKMGIAKWPFRDRLLAQKHEEEEAEEAARRMGGIMGPDGLELDETAQQRVVADMLLMGEWGDDEDATSCAETPKMGGGDDTPPARGPMSEASEGSVVDTTSCDASVCDGSPADDDLDAAADTLAPQAAEAAIAGAAAPGALARPSVHPAQAPYSSAKPVAPPPARVAFKAPELGAGRDTSTSYVLRPDETCAYPPDSLLDEFSVGDAGVFDGCVADMDATLYLD